jgi:GDP-4-dehydro-6-deoxy-D-mannose reductase
LLDTLLSFTDVNIRVEIDPERYRSVDVPVVYGSAEKFYQLTRWVPEFSFEETLKDTLEYWREQVKTQTGGSTHAQ